MNKAFYFGAWDGPGHYLFEAGSRNPSHIYVPHLLGQHVDAQFAPCHHKYRRKLCWAGQGTTDEERQRIGYDSSERPQGMFLRHELNGFTLISWWDRNQGDKRGGCNSNFILEGEHSSEVMVKRFRVLFPTIAENLDRAGVKLVDVTPKEDNASQD